MRSHSLGTPGNRREKGKQVRSFKCCQRLKGGLRLRLGRPAGGKKDDAWTRFGFGSWHSCVVASKWVDLFGQPGEGPGSIIGNCLTYYGDIGG